LEQGPQTVDLKQALGVLRRRGALVALCALLVAGAAFEFSKHQTKKYAATASVVFSNNSLSQQIAGLSVGGGASSSALLAQEATNVELLKGGGIAAKTASAIGHGLTAEKVASSVSVSGQGESDVVDISATSTSPLLAAKIANSYASHFVNSQQSANRTFFSSALALVNKQLAAIPPKQRFGTAAVALQNRAETLSFLAELNYDTVQLAQEALIPASPSSPKASKNTALGLLLGLFLGLGLAFLLERLDRRIRRPDELESIYRLPMLGAIPKSSALAGSAQNEGRGPVALSPAEAEAFNLLRAHLRFFNINRDLRTIVLASAALGDGKSTIACHLAEAATRLGSRVLLLEADLRNPTLAQQLGVQSGPGLADVLIGEVPMSEATQPVELEAAPGKGGTRRLDVLTAGAVLPPNPGELLESAAMSELLEQARSDYDLVVVDAPPLAAVSDAFPLLREVDGVVIVGWVGRSRRDAAERLQQVLASSGATLLGVVANGSKPDDHRVYAYTGDRGPGSRPDAASSNGTGPSEKLVSAAKA
jgi:capsular exopolysaccharide synthesis family protein